MELTNNFTNYLLAKPFQNFAVYNNPLSNLEKDWNIVAKNPYLFNHEIQYDFKITDQKSSGRCWLFATLNLLRFVAGQTWSDVMDVKDLEFSQSYLYFWDKFERYNQFVYTFALNL
jgi:bleomycin hydrolase